MNASLSHNEILMVSVKTPNKVTDAREKKRCISRRSIFFFIKLLVGKNMTWKFTIHCQICYGTCCNCLCGFILWVLKQYKQGRKSTCFSSDLFLQHQGWEMLWLILLHINFNKAAYRHSGYVIARSRKQTFQKTEIYHFHIFIDPKSYNSEVILIIFSLFFFSFAYKLHHVKS